MRPETLLDLILTSDALRRPERLDGLLLACAADALSRPGHREQSYAPSLRINAALRVVRDVDAAAIAAHHAGARDLPERIRSARLAALQQWAKKVPVAARGNVATGDG